MIIVHIDFTGTYNEEMNYQENLLPRAQVELGHKVYFITTCYRWDQGDEVKVAQCRYIMNDGVELIRLPYAAFGGESFEKKIRLVPGITKVLISLNPDVIYIHCIQTFSCLLIVKYAEKNPQLRLYADTHTDYNNSASSLLSKHILHKIIYKYISKKIELRLNKMFYVSEEAGLFIREMYGFPKEKMHFLPLGGFIIEGEQHEKFRKAIRSEHMLLESDIIFLHTGKFDAAKKTLELVRAFKCANLSNRSKLIIIGTFRSKEYENRIIEEISDSRNVFYLGWVQGNELTRWLCASDVYVQPGSQSATMQNALCCGCAVVLFPFKSHRIYLNNNGFFVSDENDIMDSLTKIDSAPDMLTSMHAYSYAIAHSLLDYNKQASFIS